MCVAWSQKQKIVSLTNSARRSPSGRLVGGWEGRGTQGGEAVRAVGSPQGGGEGGLGGQQFTKYDRSARPQQILRSRKYRRLSGLQFQGYLYKRRISQILPRPSS